MNKEALRFATDVIEAIKDDKIASANIEARFAESGNGVDLIYTFVIRNPKEMPSTD